MTPREKAIELVNAYLQIYDGNVDKGKQCALIAIELALEFVGGELDVAFDKTVFLVAVKHEIIEMKKEWSKPKLK